MKKIVCTVFLCTLALYNPARAADVLTEQRSASVSVHDEVDIDLLIEDAQQQGVDQEVIQIKEVSGAEYWLRRIGSALFVKYLACKYYIGSCWDSLWQ